MLLQIEEDGFCSFDSGEREQAGVFRAGPVAGSQRGIVHSQLAIGNLHPGTATRL